MTREIPAPSDSAAFARACWRLYSIALSLPRWRVFGRYHSFYGWTWGSEVRR